MGGLNKNPILFIVLGIALVLTGCTKSNTNKSENKTKTQQIEKGKLAPVDIKAEVKPKVDLLAQAKDTFQKNAIGSKEDNSRYWSRTTLIVKEGVKFNKIILKDKDSPQSAIFYANKANMKDLHGYALFDGANTFYEIRDFGKSTLKAFGKIQTIEKVDAVMDEVLNMVQQNKLEALQKFKPQAGCGSGWTEKVVPDHPMGRNYRPCCNVHDDCYENCSKSQGTCDKNFHKCLKGKSYTRVWGKSVCTYCWLAWSYYQAVNWFGGSAYRSAQSAKGCK